MKPPFIRSPYNYDTDKASQETAYVEKLPSLTVQSQALDTDINELIRRVGQGAPMPQNLRLPQYGDYSEITDFRSALDAVENAQREFMTLPANVRAHFENNPQAFLDFAQTPGSLEQLKAWGLTTPQPIAAPGAPTAPQTPPAGEKSEQKGN